MPDRSTEPKDQRVTFMMTASELNAVDDWSFARRIRSRAEAICQLLALGLKASEKGQQAMISRRGALLGLYRLRSRPLTWSAMLAS